jgi:hypothetical protein
MLLPYTPPPGGGLYIIWLSDTHYYGGRTKSFADRWGQHLAELQRGSHGNPRMQNVWNKYRRFEPQALKTCATREDRVAFEQAWLDKHFCKPDCVNLANHAHGGAFTDWTPEMLQRMSEAQTGKVRSKASIRKQVESWRQNPENAEKARRQIRTASKCITPEGRARAGEATRQRLTGVKQSPETIEKRRKKHIGRKNTPETKRKMSESAKKRAVAQPTQHGSETRAKISAQQKGRVWINNGERNRRVFPSDIPAEGGWVRGKLGACGTGLWVHRYQGEEIERLRVPHDMLRTRLAEGWVRGTGPQVRSRV